MMSLLLSASRSFVAVGGSRAMSATLSVYAAAPFCVVIWLPAGNVKLVNSPVRAP
jgi:hypothetical protein